MRNILPGATLLKPFTYEQQLLPITKPIAQYIRQSTAEQVKNNIQSFILQDEEMAARLTAVGFTDIMKIALDQGISGQKRRDERKGLDHLYKLIETHAVGAIAAYDASRLYRDSTHVEDNMFIQLLVQHAVPVIMYDEESGIRVYWPNKQQDMDALREEFMQAAFYLRHIYGKVLPAKLKAIESGSYGGGCVPMGYIVVGEKKHKYFQPYLPHATLIVYLFKRYRELSGNLARLGRELTATGFAFPAFTGVDVIPSVALKLTHNGYPLHTRDALVSMLTNPAYIGWYVYKGVIISKTAHEAIVSMDDFLYAYNSLSPVALDGTANFTPKAYRRYGSTQALCENILTNGESRCYPLGHRAAYVARTAISKWQSTALSVPIDAIDNAVGAAVVGVLYALDFRHKQGLEDSLYAQIQALATEKAAEGVTLDTALINVDAAIRGWELDKVSCRATGNIQGLNEANRQLAKLYTTRAALLQKATDAEKERAALAETQALHAHIVEEWWGMAYERQQRFLHLLVEAVDMQEVSPHILHLTLTFKQPIGITLHGYLYRHYGDKVKWSDAENQNIHVLYPAADRLAILQALPQRTYSAIQSQARLLGVERARDSSTIAFNANRTYADQQLIERVQAEYPGVGAYTGCVWQPFPSAILGYSNEQGYL